VNTETRIILGTHRETISAFSKPIVSRVWIGRLQRMLKAHTPFRRSSKRARGRANLPNWI